MQARQSGLMTAILPGSCIANWLIACGRSDSERERKAAVAIVAELITGERDEKARMWLRQKAAAGDRHPTNKLAQQLLEELDSRSSGTWRKA